MYEQPDRDDEYKGEDSSELASDQERRDAEDPNVGSGSPETAPHEPVKQRPWERLSGRYPKIPEHEVNPDA